MRSCTATASHVWRGTLLSIAVVLVLGCSDDPAGPPQAPGFQGVVDSLARAWNLPGLVVGIRRSGEEPSVFASGRAELTSGRRMTSLDRFRIGSLTKPMVATVILQLADEGRLSLDDSLARFLPGILPEADRITLRQLLNHTSGIGDYVDDPGFVDAALANPSRVWTPQQLIAIANGMPRRFTPGAADRWDYSNTNYILLGLVAEVAGDAPIAALLLTRVFEPLGMTSTYLSNSTALVAPFAQGYADLNGISNLAVGTLVSPTVAGAAGAVVSTAGDLLRFVEALAAGDLVSPAAHAARLTTVPASRLRYPGESFDNAYGLGVLVGDGWIGHNGAIPGYETEAYAKQDVGSVVVLVNKSTGVFAALPIMIAVRDRTFAVQ
ncbi:MAG TPA: serine hydrolase domain-containing protein [Gemmatimonadaceae bacterium]|nr:serine hydrolase domain-containing protein [Gemmatimonadaceae bacterium]